MLKLDVYRQYYSTYHGLELQPDVNLPYMRTTTENGILYYAEFLMLLHIRNDLDALDRARFYKLVKDLQVTPGLYDRGAGESINVPYSERRTISHDNIDAVCAGSVICDYTFQDDVIQYGTKNLFMFNNVKPRLVPPVNPGNYSPWFCMANKNFLAFIFLPFMIINLIITRFRNKQSTSSRKLYLLELYAITQKKKNTFFSLIAKVYFAGLVKIYGEDFIYQLYSIYYPAAHPLVAFSKGINYRKGKFVVEE